jgi:hypothetical protein
LIIYINKVIIIYDIIEFALNLNIYIHNYY